MINLTQGNRILYLTLALGMAVAALFVKWGSLQLSPADFERGVAPNGQNLGGGMFGILAHVMLGSTEIALTGTNGHLTLGPVQLPFWLATAVVLTGVVFTITNALKLSSVSRLVVIPLLLAGGAFGLWAASVFLSGGSLGVGPAFLIVASVLGLMQQRTVTE